MNSSKFVVKLVHICFNCLIVVAICAVLIMIGKTAYDFGYRIFAEPAMSSEEDAIEVYVQITEDMSLKDIADTIEELGLARSNMLFFIQLQLSDYRQSIEPGIYTVNTGMTPSEIITCLGTQEPILLEDGETETEDENEDDTGEESQDGQGDGQ